MAAFTGPIGGDVGQVTVVTTNNTGLTPEHWTARAMQQIMHVADNSESPIKAQALAFQDRITDVVLFYMKEAIKSDRTTLYNLLLKQGETEMAELLRRLS